MPRERFPFRQSDVTRAVAGAKKAGLKVAKVKISPAGEIEVITTDDPAAKEQPKNPWDDLYVNPPNVR